jgi:hypothetical protein
MLFLLGMLKVNIIGVPHQQWLKAGDMPGVAKKRAHQREDHGESPGKSKEEGPPKNGWPVWWPA